MGSTAITLFILFSSPTLTYAFGSLIPQFWRRSSSTINPLGFYNPLDNGGSQLTQVTDTYPLGLGEPLNAIISGNSDARVLVDAETNGGLRNYFLSFGFAAECLGQHAGAAQAANLGDGNGFVNETGVIRWNYGDPQLGTCKETIQGGNHFRYWRQNGAQGNSSAIFMAVSSEMPLNQAHNIIVNGYNLGRDWLIGNITQSLIPTQNLTNTSTFTGTTSWNNFTYQSQISYISGLLQNTNIGINHNLTVSVNGVNATDGLVALIDVKITGSPKSHAWKLSPTHLWQLLPAFVVLTISILPVFVTS